MRYSFLIVAWLGLGCTRRVRETSVDGDDSFASAGVLAELLFAPASASVQSRLMQHKRVMNSVEDSGLLSQQMDLNKFFKAHPRGMVVMGMPPEGQIPENVKLSEQASSRRSDVVMADGARSKFVPDMQRRTIMNYILLAAAAVPTAWIGGGYLLYFVPPSAGGGGAGLVALDNLGNQITFQGWLDSHEAGDRKLVQGLKGDAHYLLITKEKTIEDYAINAVCTHLGCVVPWNRAANKFMCPCHGSQYDSTGKVVRGPAPLSLALAHVVDNGDNKVTLTPWTEQDFRTGLDPWWK